MQEKERGIPEFIENIEEFLSQRSSHGGFFGFESEGISRMFTLALVMGTCGFWLLKRFYLTKQYHPYIFSRNNGNRLTEKHIQELVSLADFEISPDEEVYFAIDKKNNVAELCKRSFILITQKNVYFHLFIREGKIITKGAIQIGRISLDDLHDIKIKQSFSYQGLIVANGEELGFFWDIYDTGRFNEFFKMLTGSINKLNGKSWTTPAIRS